MSTNPNTVKSQHELTNEGGRKSDVLLSTIDKIADLEEWKKDMQAKYGNKSAELEKTKKQLEIALSSMRDSRELLYQLSQILVADAIGKQLKEIEELNR